MDNRIIDIYLNMLFFYKICYICWWTCNLSVQQITEYTFSGIMW